MTSRITGNKTAEDIIRRYYERLNTRPDEDTSTDTHQEPLIRGLLQDNFYCIERQTLQQVLGQTYIQYLREANYGDVDTCSGIGFSKRLLRVTPELRQTAEQNDIALQGNDGDYLVNISHTNANALVQASGYKLPTTALMYKLFIPLIKELARQGDAEAQATLQEMKEKAEWLEDRILQKTRLVIGTQERTITLPSQDGKFDRADLSDYGYPREIKKEGEFYYWFPRSDEIAAIRSGGSGLDLDLNWEPSIVYDGLGVRYAKFFP